MNIGYFYLKDNAWIKASQIQMESRRDYSRLVNIRLTLFKDDPNLLIQNWYVGNNIHRLEAPAANVISLVDGCITKSRWHVDNKLLIDFEIHYYKNSSIEELIEYLKIHPNNFEHVMKIIKCKNHFTENELFLLHSIETFR